MVPGFIPRFCSMVPIDPSSSRIRPFEEAKRLGLFSTGLSFLCESAGIERAHFTAPDGLRLGCIKNTCHGGDGFFRHHEQCIQQVDAQTAGEVQFPLHEPLHGQRQVAIAWRKPVGEMLPERCFNLRLHPVQFLIHKSSARCVEKEGPGHICQSQPSDIPVKSRSQGNGHEDDGGSSLQKPGCHGPGQGFPIRHRYPIPPGQRHLTPGGTGRIAGWQRIQYFLHHGPGSCIIVVNACVGAGSFKHFHNVFIILPKPLQKRKKP